MTQTKLPIRSFADSESLEACLSAQPADSPGFWLKLSKIGAPRATIGKDAAIEAALCCGWIDGQLGKFDAHHYLIRMTPRRASSPWSQKNRSTAERLAREGRLKPAGVREIERARQDGRWAAAYESQGRAEPPADLLAALGKNARAARFFADLDRANRYAIIYRVTTAKRPDTRAQRINTLVDMLARGESVHPRKAKARRG